MSLFYKKTLISMLGMLFNTGCLQNTKISLGNMPETLIENFTYCYTCNQFFSRKCAWELNMRNNVLNCGLWMEWLYMANKQIFGKTMIMGIGWEKQVKFFVFCHIYGWFFIRFGKVSFEIEVISSFLLCFRHPGFLQRVRLNKMKIDGGVTISQRSIFIISLLVNSRERSFCF